MAKKKALIGMSGGVDSSVAAYLTQQAGYDCVGAMLRLYDNEILTDQDTGTCCTLDDAEDARSIARRLGIPFHVFNAKSEFAEKVIANFIHCYECGATPNPCIECNRHLKFRHLLRKATELGCDYIVTGHYARIRLNEETGRYLLYRAADPSKDQSYVLACLTQEQLSHTLFPLGEMSKAEARSIAEAQGFINARKHDSQDICFVPDGDYVAFMERYTGKRYTPGDFLDLQGNVVGRHKGAVAYTLGQRKGLGLAMGSPVYVCAKDVSANTVTVGPNEALFSTTLIANNWNWFPFPALTAPIRVSAKARYNQPPQPATVYPEEHGRARVVFDQPQRALTPGQAVVLYDGDMVVGGGTIQIIE
jgi:tRNA-specific 2-thiouridylase